MSEQEKQDQAEKPVKLVHYTTAEAAYSILSTGRFYITKITNADDKLELDYGYKKLIESKKEAKQKYSKTLKKITL